jgi:uncharacterized membrane protein YgcG
MRLTRLSFGILTLLFLIAVPVNAAPPIHKGSQASYHLSVSISFNQSCQPIPSSTLSPGIVCPMIATFSPSLNINGTLGWNVTDLNASTASLNVTRDTTTSTSDTSTPVAHHTESFNESINLATRIATILPFIEPEMNQAIQAAQTSMGTSVPSGTDWTPIMSTVIVPIMRQPVYTMWWVNGPLKANDTVKVLVFPTNVTGSTSVDVGGSIGPRSVWTLGFNRTLPLPPPDPLAATTSVIPIPDRFEFALTFNYDKAIDLLLSASADIHLGFGVETILPPIPCVAPANAVCPGSSPLSIMRDFGIDVQASLKLISTTLGLGPSPNSSGSSGGSDSGSGAGTRSGSGGGYNPGSGGTTTGAGPPASNPLPSKPATQSVRLLPWLYGVLGIIAAAIVASGVWIASRRMKKTLSPVSPVQ